MTSLKRIRKILFTQCAILSQSLYKVKSESEKRHDKKEDDDFVRIFKPDERKFTIPDFNKWEDNRFSNDLPLWIFFSFAIVILFVFVCCCLFFFLARKRSANRHASNAALIHPPPSTIQLENSIPPNNIQSFAFPNAAFQHDRVNDVPPDYAAVVLPSPPAGETNANRPRYPRVDKSKKVETPPPAYITVAPFQ